jgi:hypothetical protein
MCSTNNDRVKNWREENNEKWKKSLYSYWKKPYICECGSIMTTKNKYYHLKSKKHTKNMQILNDKILNQK